MTSSDDSAQLVLAASVDRSMPRAPVLSFTGEIDLASAPLIDEHVRTELESGQALDGLRVDLAAVTYIDSTGLRTLLELVDRCDKAAVPVMIVASRRVKSVIEMAGLTPLLSAHLTDG